MIVGFVGNFVSMSGLEHPRIFFFFRFINSGEDRISYRLRILICKRCRRGLDRARLMSPSILLTKSQRWRWYYRVTKHSLLFISILSLLSYFLVIFFFIFAWRVEWFFLQDMDVFWELNEVILVIIFINVQKNNKFNYKIK